MKREKLSDAELYANCMERIKRRLDSVYRLIRRETNTGALITDVEYVALQLRKVLEGIALASICAHREAYEAIRKEIWKDWNARLITQDIERINPNFYPESLEIEDGPPDRRGARGLRPRKDGYLDKKQFIRLYKKTASLLHEDNPFSEGANSNYRRLLQEFSQRANEIVILLNKHQVSPREEVMWVVQMHVEPEYSVVVTEFSGQGPYTPVF